jgi:hypothetical protein
VLFFKNPVSPLNWVSVLVVCFVCMSSWVCILWVVGSPTQWF